MNNCKIYLSIIDLIVDLDRAIVPYSTNIGGRKRRKAFVPTFFCNFLIFLLIFLSYL